ncbi:MAG: hypothetical protein NVV72_18430 [Asticcacaulis sp.]|nr:hypothetical protein [Asticcacaulis sp.]
MDRVNASPLWFEDDTIRALALAGADSLLWAYDLSCGRFEFRGDAQALDLLPLNGVFTLEDLMPLFASGETDRLDMILKTLEVRTVAGLPGEAHVQCLMRLKDRRLLYFKGRKVRPALVLGTVTEMSRDIRQMPDADSLVQDIHIDPLTGLYNRRGFLSASRALFVA